MNDWRNELNQVEIEKRRWAVITHLEASAPTRSLSSDILIMGCRAQGVPTTNQQIEDTLLWLVEGGFIRTEQLGPMQTATITRTGREIAQRVRTVPGFVPFGLDG